MIKETTNYDMFKKHMSNAPLEETNVLRVIRSIQAKNLLKYKPILVDSEFRVIDGQHRLEAAKRLEIPIFYEQNEMLTTQDMRLLNEARVWRREYYLDHFCQEGYPEYIKLKEFMRETDLSLSGALAVLGITTNSNQKSSRGKNTFKHGLFEFPNEEQRSHSIEVLSKINRFIEFYYNKLTGNKQFLRNPVFHRSMYLFLSIKRVDFEVLMNKAQYKLDLLRPCSKVSSYITIFKAIYNWKNSNPIDVSELNLTENW